MTCTNEINLKYLSKKELSKINKLIFELTMISWESICMFIAGSYADWSNNEPDGEICGVIDEEVQNKRLYADEHCNSQFAFICQIGMILF